MSNLWKALEQAGAEGAPLYNWKMWLGEELEPLLAHCFLSHSSEKAESLVVKDRLGFPIRYRLIEHSPKEIVAKSDEGDRITIAPPDRMIVKVDHRVLAKSLAVACGFAGESVTTAPRSGLYRLGKAAYPKRGYVFASFKGSEAANLAAFAFLRQYGIGDANIFLLGREQATTAVITMADANGWEILLMRDYFDFSPKSGFAAKAGTSPLGQSSEAAVNQWPLKRPAKPSWKEIRMRFPEDDSEMIHISFGQHGRLFRYREISQFVDNRDGSRNDQWELLRQFAKSGGKSGRITRGRDDKAKEKIYRRFRTLKDALKEFFGLPDDPFHDLDSETVARFDVGMKGTPAANRGEKSSEVDEYFEEISSHERLYKEPFNNGLE